MSLRCALELPVGIDHFERGLDDPELADPLQAVIEDLGVPLTIVAEEDDGVQGDTRTGRPDEEFGFQEVYPPVTTTVDVSAANGVFWMGI